MPATRRTNLNQKVFVTAHSWQNVRGNDAGAERASWSFADSADVIKTTRRTRRNFAVFVQLDVRRQIVWKINFVIVGQMMFQSKLIRSGINLAEVVDAGVRGAGNWLADKVGNRNGDKQRDNKNYKQDSPNRKSGTGVFILFTHTLEQTPRPKFRCR